MKVICNEKDDKDHFLSCSQASGMGEATRNILSELSPDKKAVSWQQIGSLELNLPPVQHLPALILISELGMEIHRSRAKKKPLEISIFTSNLKSRAEVIGKSRKHQDGKHELTNWIDEQLIILDANTERNLPTTTVSLGTTATAPCELTTGGTWATRNPTKIT